MATMIRQLLVDVFSDWGYEVVGIGIAIAVVVVIILIPAARKLLRGSGAFDLAAQLGLTVDGNQMSGPYQGYDLELWANSPKIEIWRRSPLLDISYQLSRKGPADIDLPEFDTGHRVIDDFFAVRTAQPEVAQVARERAQNAAQVARFIEKWGSKLDMLNVTQGRIVCSLREGVGCNPAQTYLPVAQARELLPQLTAFADAVHQWLTPADAEEYDVRKNIQILNAE